MCIHLHSTATHGYTFFSDKVLDSAEKPGQTRRKILLLGWFPIAWAGPSGAWTGLCCMHPEVDCHSHYLLFPLESFVHILKYNCIFPCAFSWSEPDPPPPPPPHTHTLPTCRECILVFQGLWWASWQQYSPWAFQRSSIKWVKILFAWGKSVYLPSTSNKLIVQSPEQRLGMFDVTPCLKSQGCHLILW